MEVAVIPNITSYQLQLKEKHQIFPKQWLIHLNCVTAFEIDAGSTWNGTGPIYATQTFPILVMIQRENGVLLVEGHDNNKAGKFAYILKSYILNYFYFISGANL